LRKSSSSGGSKDGGLGASKPQLVKLSSKLPQQAKLVNPLAEDGGGGGSDSGSGSGSGAPKKKRSDSKSSLA
jgi:hypothetical protein